MNYTRLATTALDALLASGLEITQHAYHPRPNEWYYNGAMGEGGPFETPEAAVMAAVKRLYTLLAEQTERVQHLQQEVDDLRARLGQTDNSDGLAPWRRAFSAKSHEDKQRGNE